MNETTDSREIVPPTYGYHRECSGVIRQGAVMCSCPKQWFVIVCRECWPEATAENLVGHQPFRTAAERGSWAAKHRRSTGHDSWFVGTP